MLTGNVLWKIVSLWLDVLRVHPTKSETTMNIDLPIAGFYIRWVLSRASRFDYLSVQLASQDCYKDKMRDMADDYSMPASLPPLEEGSLY